MPASPASLLGPEGLLGGARRSPHGLTGMQGAEQQQERSGTGEKQPERPVSSRSFQTGQTAPGGRDWSCPQRNVTASTASARRAVPGGSGPPPQRHQSGATSQLPEADGVVPKAGGATLKVTVFSPVLAGPLLPMDSKKWYEIRKIYLEGLCSQSHI